jgi:hypothetical protein
VGRAVHMDEAAVVIALSLLHPVLGYQRCRG